MIAAVLTGLSVSLATAQPASAKPFCDVPDPPPICDGGGDDDPPPANSPQLYLDAVQQTTSRFGVHLWGWTADDDARTTPLTVHVTMDGAAVGSVTANQDRPDVAAVFPRFGPAHGFDLTLPASDAGHRVCVTAVNIGSGSNATACREMDDIVGFEVFGISYDIDHAVLSGTSLEELDKVTNRNFTTVEQSTKINGCKTVTNSHEWSHTWGAKLTFENKVKVGIPLIGSDEATVTVEGSYSYVTGRSEEESRMFCWEQPVIVPARSTIEATVTITHARVSVPYTLNGNFILRSGARAAGTVDGTFSGVNSINFAVTLRQFNLDGSPAAAPVEQLPAEIFDMGPV